MHNIVPASLAGDKYLTVRLEKEAYGVPVMTVREIIRLQRATPVANLPAYVKGSIDLRGRIIPLVDLRVRLGLRAEFAARTCIVVVQVTMPAGRFAPLGLVVDGIEEVASVPVDDIESSSDEEPDTGCLHRSLSAKSGLKAVLDVDHIVSPAVLQTVIDAAS